MAESLLVAAFQGRFAPTEWTKDRTFSHGGADVPASQEVKLPGLSKAYSVRAVLYYLLIGRTLKSSEYIKQARQLGLTRVARADAPLLLAEVERRSAGAARSRDLKSELITLFANAHGVRGDLLAGEMPVGNLDMFQGRQPRGGGGVGIEYSRAIQWPGVVDLGGIRRLLTRNGVKLAPAKKLASSVAPSASGLPTSVGKASKKASDSALERRRRQRLLLLSGEKRGRGSTDTRTEKKRKTETGAVPGESRTQFYRRHIQSLIQDRSVPIIVVPSGVSHTLSIWNARLFLKDGRWMPTNACRQIAFSASQSNSDQTNNEIKARAQATQAEGTVSFTRGRRQYLVCDVTRVPASAWSTRVVAMFISGRGRVEFSRIKKTSMQQPARLFASVCGLYLGKRGAPVPKSVMHYRVNRFSVEPSRESSGNRAVVRQIWSCIDKFEAQRRFQR